MPNNNWIRFLRNYGPIPTNDNMYDETIQRALTRLKIAPIELPAPHLDWLVDNFRSEGCLSIILTGTAGDGKTYHCRRVWLGLGGTIEDWNGGAKIQRLALGARQLVVVKDLSELRADESKPLIEQMAWDVANPAAPRVYLLAANHGQLLEKLKSAGTDKTTTALVEVVENLLVTGRSGNDAIKLDLKDLSRSAAVVMIDQVIDAVTQHPGWKGCLDCPALNEAHCPIRENRERLIGTNDVGLFRSRLGSLVEASEQNGGHFTIRQALSLVTNIILGHPDAKDGLMSCNDVASLAAAGTGELASPYRNVFGGNLKRSRAERTEPFRKLHLFGIGSETSNKVDNMLVYGADDPALLATYSALVQADPIYGETPTYKRAQQAYLEGDDPSAATRFLTLLQGQRQRLFFTIGEELAENLDLWDLTVFRYAGLYLETARALAEKRPLPRQVMPMLIRGLNRVFTGMLIQNQDELVLASAGSQSQSRTSPLLEEFVSVARRGGEEVSLVGDNQGGMQLVVKLSRDDPPPISLQLSTTRFEFLGRVAEGALPSSFSLECHEDFLAFKARLLSAVERRRVLDGDDRATDIVLKFIDLNLDGRASSRSVTVRI
ncbi:hypothetical protein [uncultured Devosia sp.]|uniref:hypothetical protein n=1 Tax=uncultured Devosia sp. TaxID=211434 RepID=UPI00260E06B4|nr:hypothetical protein [uncultured Devosia sp.]